jgi:hypothetical protein
MFPTLSLGKTSAWTAETISGRTLAKWIAAALVATVFLVPATGRARADLTDGLVGYWPFDGTGSDRSGGGRPLQLYGDVGFAPGLFGEALDLHRDNTQFAQRPIDDEIFDLGANDFTIQAWVNFNTTTAEQTIVEKFQGINGPGWTVTKQAANTLQFYAMPSGVVTSDPLPIPTGVWLQVVVRRTGDLFELFFDGMLVGSGENPNPVPPTTFPLLVGKRNDAGQRFPVDGRIDEVAIWLRALDDAELAFLWNDGDGNPVRPPRGFPGPPQVEPLSPE